MIHGVLGENAGSWHALFSTDLSKDRLNIIKLTHCMCAVNEIEYMYRSVNPAQQF